MTCFIYKRICANCGEEYILFDRIYPNEVNKDHLCFKCWTLTFYRSYRTPKRNYKR